MTIADNRRSYPIRRNKTLKNQNSLYSTPRLWITICAAALTIGCGDDAESTFHIDIEAEDGTSTSLSDTIGGDELVGSDSGSFLTPGVLRVELAGADGELIEIQLVTSETDTAPGTFPVAEDPASVRYNPTSEDLYTSTDTGAVVLDNCPTELDDHVVGSLDNVEVAHTETDETRTLSGDFDIGILSIQHNGDDAPLDCE